MNEKSEIVCKAYADKAAARAVIVAELDALAVELSEALERVSNVLLGEGYIVVLAGRGVAFKMDGKVASSPSSVRIDRAPRFTKRDAEMLAAEVTNGNGEKAKAVHIRTALMENIEEIVDLKMSIKEMAK